MRAFAREMKSKSLAAAPTEASVDGDDAASTRRDSQAGRQGWQAAGQAPTKARAFTMDEAAGDWGTDKK